MPAWRIGLFALGLALLVVAVASPIAEIGETELFSFHMGQHLLLGDLAPLCLLAGVTGPILRPLLALPGVMRLRVLANPLVAFPIWTANLVLWHVPAMYEGALDSSLLHALEHVSFFTAGTRPLAAGPRAAPGSRVVRHRLEARLHRRRSPGRDRDRERVRLGWIAVLRHL